jgi:hypothetical protein
MGFDDGKAAPLSMKTRQSQVLFLINVWVPVYDDMLSHQHTDEPDLLCGRILQGF